jgi:hypothetical protein
MKTDKCKCTSPPPYILLIYVWLTIKIWFFPWVLTAECFVVCWVCLFLTVFDRWFFFFLIAERVFLTAFLIFLICFVRLWRVR